MSQKYFCDNCGRECHRGIAQRELKGKKVTVRVEVKASCGSYDYCLPCMVKCLNEGKVFY